MKAEERRAKTPLIVSAVAELVYARPTPRCRYVYPRRCTPFQPIIVICSVAGEQAGAADENDKLEQIQPRRWSPSAWSCCTSVATVLCQAVGGSFSSVLIAELAEASIFIKICPDDGGCIAAATGAAPAHQPPPALEPVWTICRICRSHALLSFLSA